MSFQEPLDSSRSDLIKAAQKARRAYFKKSLIEYGFTPEESEILLESVDEFVEEEKDLTEEDKESLYRD